MIKFKDILLEKFEIPSDLKKQLENTAYSALGRAILPQIEQYKKTIFLNKKYNDTSYTDIKKVLDTAGSKPVILGPNKTYTLSILNPEDGYFSIDYSLENFIESDITIEKSGNDVYVSSKTDKTFPSFYISKDSLGWDLHTLNSMKKRYKQSYDAMIKDFEDKIVLVTNIENLSKNWIKRDNLPSYSTKEEIHYNHKNWNNNKYNQFFRIFKNVNNDPESYYKNYFNAGDNDGLNPSIVQTIYLDHFGPNVPSLEFFMKYVNQYIRTTNHEGRHLMQYFGQKNKNLKGDYYGGPKKDITHSKNPNIRGINPAGEPKPNSVVREPGDNSRVPHQNRDVEFKTNLYDYKIAIENLLSKNAPKSKWNTAFKRILEYIMGKLHSDSFISLFPYGYRDFDNTVTKSHLKSLYDQDKPKFNQFVKEIYKLIFS